LIGISPVQSSAVRLLVRADGSAAMGLGHVMRTLAVAQEAAANGHDVSYVMHDDPVACQLPERRGFKVTRLPDADDRSWLTDVQPGDRVVFDGYPFLANGITGDARQRGATVAAVDDHDGGDVEADVVVNPNAVDPARYVRATAALCGPGYALVRSEFLPYRRQRGEHARTLVVTLGGSDAGGLTEPLLGALDTHRPFEHVVLVAGPAAPEPPARPRLEVVRDPSDVAATFDRADAAISAAGSTTWELLCLGVPSVLIEVAPNQRLVALTAARHGAAFVAATIADVVRAVDDLTDVRTRSTVSGRALATVDGLGARRVVHTMFAPIEPS
jgi:spore coat polysaccharide biosynthesis predicted glycosyltransferase SpsG